MCPCKCLILLIQHRVHTAVDTPLQLIHLTCVHRGDDDSGGYSHSVRSVILLIRMQRAHFPKGLFSYVPDTVQYALSGSVTLIFFSQCLCVLPRFVSISRHVIFSSFIVHSHIASPHTNGSDIQLYCEMISHGTKMILSRGKLHGSLCSIV